MSTKAAILAETLRLFNRDGWREVSMRSIAEHLQMSPGNLTYHFPKKEVLMKAVLSELWEAEKQTYLSIFMDRIATATLLSGFQQVFREQLDNHGILSGQYLFYDELYDNHPDHPEEKLRLEQFKQVIFMRILKNLVLQGELKAADEDISFLASFMLLLSRSWILDHSLDGEEDINRYLYLLAQQLYYFATVKGMSSIDFFLEHL